MSCSLGSSCNYVRVRGQGRGAGPQPDPYVTGGPLVWWLRVGHETVCEHYLVALLMASECSPDTPKRVPHLQKSKYYQELVKEFLGPGGPARPKSTARRAAPTFDFHLFREFVSGSENPSSTKEAPFQEGSKTKDPRSISATVIRGLPKSHRHGSRELGSRGSCSSQSSHRAACC